MAGVVDSDAARALRRRYGVPDGIHLRVDAREVLAYLPGYEMAVREVATHPDDLPLSRRRGGRAALKRLDLPGQRLLVREYLKGGLLRHLRGPGMRGRWRPLDELALHRRLAILGVPVADAVGCVVLRGAVGWRGFLLVREVEGAVDLEALLHGLPVPEGTNLHRVLEDAGRAVRRLHDAGVPHPDLHPKNLLVAPDGRVIVLDLDKAVPTAGVLDDRVRLKNLVRLGRSVEKHRLKGIVASRRDALRFLRGYAGSREAAHLWLERIRATLGRSLRLRILWWRLIGEARPWRPPSTGEA